MDTCGNLSRRGTRNICRERPEPAMNTAAANRVEMIPGPVGQLEAAITEVGERQQLAILCHPHSQYGGSMHDSVLGALSDACINLGVSVLTFNFRSVGASEGRFAEGVGEIDDVLAVLKWASEHYPDAELTLGGYSFGAAMALLAAARSKQDLQRLLLVAPPIQMVESDAALVLPIKVILGGRDTIVSAAAAGQYFKSEQIAVLPQADHFFANSAQDISDIVASFFAETV